MAIPRRLRHELLPHYDTRAGILQSRGLSLFAYLVVFFLPITPLQEGYT